MGSRNICLYSLQIWVIRVSAQKGYDRFQGTAENLSGSLFFMHHVALVHLNMAERISSEGEIVNFKKA